MISGGFEKVLFKRVIEGCPLPPTEYCLEYYRCFIFRMFVLKRAFLKIQETI